MSLNENSNRDQILRCIEEDPLYFLFDHSHKPWAQSYIDEAAKRALKRSPFYFLSHFSNKTWAQPYLDEAAEMAVKQNPEFFLKEWAVKFPKYTNTALFSLGDKK